MGYPESLERVLRIVEEGIASAAPDEFFRFFTRRLAEASGVRCAFITESSADGESDDTLVACWMGEGYAEGEQFIRTQTPLASGPADRPVQVPSGLAGRVEGGSWLADCRGESLVAVPLFSRGGLPIGWLGVIDARPIEDSANITLTLEVFARRAAAELERAALERKLTESEQRYRRLVEGSPDMVYRLRLNPGLGFEYVNGAAARLFGYTTEQLISADREFLLALLADDEERSDVEEVISGRTFYPARVRRWTKADGSVMWAETHQIPVYDDRGTLIAVEGTLRDVTAREQATKSLEDAEESKRRLIESLPDVVLRLDDEANLLEIVPTAASGRLAREGMDHLAAGLASKEALDEVRKALRSGAPRTFRSHVANGRTERTFEFRVVPMGSREVLGLVRDITVELWAAGEDDRRRQRDELEGTVERQIGVRNPYQFTFREFTVLHLVAKGASDKEIANQLGIAVSTANKHVSNILGKMGAASRTEASVRAVQEALA